MLHHVEATATDLASGTRRYSISVFIHTLDLHPVHGTTGTVGNALGAVIGTANGDHATRFGQAVGGHHHFKAKLFAHLSYQLHRYRSCTGYRQAQAGQIVVLPLRMGQQGLVDSRRAGDHGDFFTLDLRQYRVQIEIQHRQYARATNNCRQPTGLVAEGVEERVDNQVVVICSQSDCAAPVLEGTDILTVTGHHTLGVTGRTGGKQYIESIFRGNSGRPTGHFLSRYGFPTGQEGLPGLDSGCSASERHNTFQAR